MKKSLSGIVISSIIIVAFSIYDIASAALLQDAQKKPPLKLSQLESFIKTTPDSAVAIEIQQRGLAFSLTENQLTRLKQLGAGSETIRALRAWIKKPDKPTVKAPPKVESASNKVIILVANFDGPDPQQYRVTEHIIEQLKAATKKYSDIEIQPLAQTITVQQGGSEVARDIGIKRKASIVLWGWYAANTEAGSIHTYFEVLREPKGLSLSQNIEKQTATISELRGFKIQIKLSGEMAYLTLLTVGLARYESGDYDGAIDRFTAAINQSDVPNQMVSPADIYFYRGNANYLKAGVNGIDHAIADYDNAIKLKPELADVYNNRAVAYGKKGDYDREVADLTQAIKLKPDYASAYNNRGATYGNRGDNDRAIADYDNAIKFKPDYATAYNNRGAAYGNKGDYDRAIADFNQAIKFKPDYADAYNNRAVAYSRKGDYDRAIADSNQAIKLKPDYADAYNNRGAAYGNKGDYDRAIADFNQAIKFKPDYAEAYYNRASVYSGKGDYDRAITDYDNAIKFKPDYASAYYNRGIAYGKKGDYDREIASYDNAIKFRSDYASAYYNRAVAYGKKGDNDRAIADFNQAIKLKPDYANVYCGRALAYRLKGERERAIADLNHVLQISKDSNLRQIAQQMLQELGVK